MGRCPLGSSFCLLLLFFFLFVPPFVKKISTLFTISVVDVSTEEKIHKLSYEGKESDKYNEGSIGHNGTLETEEKRVNDSDSFLKLALILSHSDSVELKLGKSESC